MIMFKCKMCGGDIRASDGEVFGTCDSCGITSTLPKAGDQRLANLFNRANHFRMHNEFDRALGVYESLLNEDGANAEAHWCAVLCRYGIEYVEDPRTRVRIPTCHRVQFENILGDADYLAALENAQDAYSRELYEIEAKKISEIQRSILAISSIEVPYDVFICYKDTTDGGSRTVDSTIAQDIYYQLTNEGFRVFFSRITLEDKLGRQYEPYIFAALNSARVMLAIGTRKEHFDAVWVKNEWSRYLALMKKDRSRLLIPCYRDMDAYDLPDELANLQSLDMGRIGFAQDLIRGVKKVLDASKATETEIPAPQPGAPAGPVPGVDSIMKRGWLFLEDRDWKQADEYFDRVLDIDPEHSNAYLGKLCAELKLEKAEMLKDVAQPISDNRNYQKVVRFAGMNTEYFAQLEMAIRGNIERAKEEKRIEQVRLEHERLEQKRLEQERLEQMRGYSRYSRYFTVGDRFVVALTADRTAVSAGKNKHGRCNVSGWRDIIAVSAGAGHTVGLKADGTVVAVGRKNYWMCDVSDWRDIIAISAGIEHTVGLKADGTIAAVGNCSFTSDLRNWQNIAAITAGHYNTFTYEGAAELRNWQNIIAVAAGYYHTFGLKADGTVISTWKDGRDQDSVHDWRDIISIAAGQGQVVGLKSDGTVVAAGSTYADQLRVENWRNIIAVAAGTDFTVGLKEDGTVIATGDNKTGACNTDGWREIVAVTAGESNTVGLKAGGTIVVAGDNSYYDCDASNRGEVRLVFTFPKA